MHNYVRYKILGVPVDELDMDGIIGTIEMSINKGDRRKTILAMNPEKVMFLRKHEDLLRFFCSATWIVPDGIGVVLAVQVLYGIKIGRLAGADIMERLCSLASSNQYRVFFYGAKEEVSREAVGILERRYPQMQIVGRRNGYAHRKDREKLIVEINRAKPHILFVALGSPAQENWLMQNLDLLDMNVCQCIGGTMDTIAGAVRRAPAIWRQAGLEWLYRLLKQPGRISRQKIYPVFALKVLANKLGLRIHSKINPTNEI
jgi:N-acetylglucosaminyldiphosphoundecaprenol N-acetyl-beta-D-mannosaminyltransferase